MATDEYSEGQIKSAGSSHRTSWPPAWLSLHSTILAISVKTDGYIYNSFNNNSRLSYWPRVAYPSLLVRLGKACCSHKYTAIYGSLTQESAICCSSHDWCRSRGSLSSCSLAIFKSCLKCFHSGERERKNRESTLNWLAKNSITWSHLNEGEARKYIFLYARKEGNETGFVFDMSFFFQSFFTEFWHSNGPGWGNIFTPKFGGN